MSFSLPAQAVEFPVMTAARAAQPALPGLENKDAAARTAEARYESLRSQVADRVASTVGPFGSTAAINTAVKPYVALLAAAAHDWIDAENALTRARTEAYSELRIARRLPTLVNEPIQLTLFDLHVELRRLIGPTAHTRIAGLSNDKGCAGDLVADRLVNAYGKSITTMLPTLGAPDAAALRRIATQIACLSSKQLSHLETALAESHARVSSRLSEHGLGDLVPAFTRYVAPLQVLVLDARKHRGARSKSWKWFVTYGPSLVADVRRLGWPGGTLWLWDRLAGRMVGYPQCSGTNLRGNCFDPAAFLQSLQDPRALGRGDCALSAMVSKGTTALPNGAQLYTCPSLPCASEASKTLVDGAPAPAAPTPAEQNNLPWPSMTQGDVDVMRGFCVQPGSGSRMQGDEQPGDCFFSNQAKNPFDNYERCMTNATGDVSQIGEFGGVPMSPECKLGASVAEGEEPTAAPAPAPAPAPKSEPEPAKPEPAEKPGILEVIFKAILNFFGKEPGGIGGELLSKEGADAQLGAGQALAEKRLRDAWMDGRISDTEFFDHHGKPPGDIGDFLKGKGGGAKSCGDPMDCSSNCTGLGQSLETARACTSNFMNDLLTAAGLPVKGTPVGHPDWVSIWHADQAPVPETDFCLVGGGSPTGPGHTSIACGLVLCPDGVATASAAGECCGSHVGSLTAALISSCLSRIYCAEGVPTHNASDRCTCTGYDPQPIIIPIIPTPGPAPELRRPP